MDNNYLILLDALKVSADRLDGQQLESNAETWDIDNLIEAAQLEEEDPLDGNESYYCVGHDGRIGLTHNDGVNVEWIYTVKQTWGGNRPGSGRKPSGKRKRNYYITDQEHEEIKKLIEQIREGNQYGREHGI